MASKATGYTTVELQAFVAGGAEVIDSALIVLRSRTADPRFSHKKSSYERKIEQLSKIRSMASKIEEVSDAR